MLKNILRHPALVHADEVSQLCSPLEKLNISYFAHGRINHKKQFSAIANNPDFSEHYLKNQYYTADIHLAQQNKLGNFFVWDAIEFTGRSAQMCQEAGEFGIYNPFTIIDKQKDGINFYHFASHSHDKQINQVYLANVDLLQLFISHFRETVQQSKSLKKVHDFTFDLSDQQSKNFEDETLVYDREDFIRTLGTNKKIVRLRFDDVLLSKQQSEIVRLVVQGKTIKEMANILKLSERTVAHYFDHVKMRLNVSTKSELIAKAIEMGVLKVKG